MPSIPSSGYTAFQEDAFQRNAFQIFSNFGYADVGIVEIRPVFAKMVADEVGITLARVSIIEISS